MGWDHLQQGGTRYGCDIWSGGIDYSAVDSPGGPLFRGDCPWRDRYKDTMYQLLAKSGSKFLATST